MPRVFADAVRWGSRSANVSLGERLEAAVVRSLLQRGHGVARGMQVGSRCCLLVANGGRLGAPSKR
jgi:hypothetical protein